MFGRISCEIVARLISKMHLDRGPMSVESHGFFWSTDLFFSLLTAGVRVHGIPILMKLSDMAEDTFNHLRFTKHPRPKDSADEKHSCHGISGLREWCACGPIWLSSFGLGIKYIQCYS